MKILIFLTTLYFSLFSSELIWSDYRKIYNMSKDNLINKPILVMMSSSTCKYCDIFLKSAEEDDGFKKFVSNNFITIKINQDEDFTPVELTTSVTPAFFILNSEMEILSEPAFGAIPINKMQEWLSKIIYEYKKIYE